MSLCKQKFWLDNPADLFCNFDVIPLTNMKLENQMNSLTRLVLLIFFVILPINTKISFMFLFISLIFIIIIYYLQKKAMENYKVENFENNIFIKDTGPNPYCDVQVTLEPNNPNYRPINQGLAGPPNPKTLIPPLITARPMDLEYWRDNNLITHSNINSDSQIDTYLSGYNVPDFCKPDEGCIAPIVDESYKINDNIIENYENQTHPQQIVSPVPITSTGYKNLNLPKQYKEGYSNAYLSNQKNPQQIVSPVPITSTGYKNLNLPKQTLEGYSNENNTSENFVYPYLKSEEFVEQPGLVNQICGYNPQQIKESNLPSNLNSGNCEKAEEMKEYNKNLFTQNIEPDVYTRNEIIEPINSHIGISFTQQFPPISSSNKNCEGLTYTEHDPYTVNPQETETIPTHITEAEIYDPRFYGYGTSYRSYTEDVTGQPRFYYDDVNSVRMPNYITRSNIDFAKYADSYGPLSNKNKCGNLNTRNIRVLAQDSFLNSSLQYKTELQQRLLRKRNSEMWQLRKYPIRTGGVWQSGAKRC
jgi:hypothetical protein